MLLEIAIPTYNGSSFLGPLLDSLIKARGDLPVTITIYDNASTDKTSEVVRSFLGSNSNIYYKRSLENYGFNANIVACISEGSADYVWLMGDDDLVAFDSVAIVFSFLKEYYPKVLYSNWASFLDGEAPSFLRTKFDKNIQLFEDGSCFMAQYDLGFISSLILRRLYAKKYLSSINRCTQMQAHLFIAARIALLEPGVCIFSGHSVVAARTLTRPRYHGVRDGFISKAKFIRQLFDDGVATDRFYKSEIRRLIGFYMIYIVIKDRSAKITPFKGLISEIWAFRVYGKNCVLRYLLVLGATLTPPFFAHIIVTLNRVRKKSKGNAG